MIDLSTKDRLRQTLEAGYFSVQSKRIILPEQAEPGASEWVIRPTILQRSSGRHEDRRQPPNNRRHSGSPQRFDARAGLPDLAELIPPAASQYWPIE